MQLSAVADEFLLDCRARRLSPRTITWYRGNLRYFLDGLAQEGAPDKLASFTLQHARRYSHALAERSVRQGTFVSAGGKRGVHALIETDRPLSANTVSGYLRTLKVFSRWLAAEGQMIWWGDVLIAVAWLCGSVAYIAGALSASHSSSS